MREERRMILQMVEDGKITAEEGVALLEALERTIYESESAQSAPQQERASQQQTTGATEQEEWRSSIHDSSEDIAQSARRIAEEVADQGRNVGTKLGDLVERFITKVKDLDFDFAFSSWSKVEKVLEGTAPTSGVIDLSTVNGKVEVQGWDRPEYRIVISGSIKADTSIEAHAILQELLHIEDNEDGLKVGLDQRKGTRISLDVFLPKQLNSDMYVRTSNGAIEVEKMKLQGIRLETTNGSITVEELTSEGLRCDTSNGRISIEDATIGDLYANTSNGSVRIEGVLSKVKCRTSNGSIRYLLTRSQAGELDFETSNGSIELRVPHKDLAISGDLSTSFGNLDCTLPNFEIVSASKEIAHRHLRFKTAVDMEQKLAIVCRTSNGGVRVHPTMD